MKHLLLAAALLNLSACATVATPANASSVAQEKITSPLDQRAEELIDVLRGDIELEDYFDHAFLTDVPAAQFNVFTQAMITQHGQPVKTVSVDKKSPNRAVLKVEFEKATATANLNISGIAPYKVNGLQVTGFEIKEDSFEKINADFSALAGDAGYVIERLNDGGANELIAARNGDKQYAIGSTFKLYILAELAAQIDAGERKWDDVIPLAHRSFFSLAMRRWPINSPMTLQSLAIHMIAVSDNSATDTLLHALGRSNVERKLAQIGHSAPDRTLPLLSTVEAFALKSPGNSALYQRFIKASEAEQRQILEQERSRLSSEQVDNAAFDNGPTYIDTIEWFASPYDISKLLNHIRKSENQSMLNILAVNQGINPDEARKWNYLGYKGGKEPGVISMSFLGQSKTGQWYAVSGSWNNPDKAVDENQFAGLMNRLLQATIQ